MFFFRLENHNFLMTYQKVVNSHQKLCHKSIKWVHCDPFWAIAECYRNFGLKLSDVMGTYRRLSHTVL